MKKWISLLVSLVMLAGLLGSASAGEPLSASVSGFGGDVTVTVELDDEGKIVTITADGSTQTPELGGNAAAALNEGALAALAGTKLADVDTSAIDIVSGATVTSEAIKTAIEMLKAQAGGAVAAAVRDGTYTVCLAVNDKGWIAFSHRDVEILVEFPNYQHLSFPF